MNATVVTRLSLKNILFATDLSNCSDAALPFALAIARKYESKLFVAHVIPDGGYPSSKTHHAWQSHVEAAENHAWKRLTELTEQWKDVPSEIFVPHGDVWATLSELVGSQDIDLIVTGTHGRKGVRKLLLGSSAEQIFRCAPCPVLTVGSHVSSEPSAVAEIREILYATNFHPNSLAAVPYAFSLAEENQAHLSLVHVIENLKATVQDPKQSAIGVLHDLDNLIPPDADLWCRPKGFVEYGVPADRILHVAKIRKADLIVMGVKRNSHPAAAIHLLSSTAYRVAIQAQCPVLTVRG